QRLVSRQCFELLDLCLDPPDRREKSAPAGGGPPARGIETGRLRARSAESAVDTRPPGHEFDIRTGIVDGEDLLMRGVKIRHQPGEIRRRGEAPGPHRNLDLPDLVRIARLDREVASLLGGARPAASHELAAAA